MDKNTYSFIKRKHLSNEGIQYKSIFREIRTLKIIEKKSEYLIQIQDLKLSNDNSEIFFYFPNEGIDLFSLINTKVFDYKAPKDLIKWIMFQILKGIETLNSLNIIHRDINPKNILISSQGKIKISGFARSINDIESKFVDDKVVGELAYISPEVLILQNFNSKIDVWGAGIVMLELYFKKSMLLMNNEDNNNESIQMRLFKQLKFLANFFGVPFNFTENNYSKEDLINWLNNAKFNQDKFRKILEAVPDLEKDAVELLEKLLNFNPKERISAKEALKMPYFQSFQNFNKDEFKKKKYKGNNDNLTLFLKNLEKEYQKIEKISPDKKSETFKKELLKLFQTNSTINC